MPTTPVDARYEMLTLFEDAWPDATAGILDYTPQATYQGVILKEPVDESKYWVRVSLKSADSRQTSFVDSEAAEKTAREYTTIGVLFVQVFAPMSEVDGYENGLKLAQAAQRIFQNAETSSSVWFRNVRIKDDLGDDGKSWLFNTVADYSFGQLN